MLRRWTCSRAGRKINSKLPTMKVVTYLRDIFSKFYSKLARNKWRLIKITVAAALLIIACFLVEYFGFGGKLNSAAETNNDKTIIKNSDIQAENFTIDADGNFISQTKDARLIIPINSRYINNLKITQTKNASQLITISYTDPGTNQEVTSVNTEQEFMHKVRVEFTNLLVFNIRSNPSQIVIQASKPDIAISKVEIDNSYIPNPYRYFFILSVAILALFLFLYRKRIGQRPEIAFLMIILICGSLLSFSERKFFVSWDGQIHFKHIERLASGVIKDMYTRPNFIPSSYSVEEQKNNDAFTDSRYKKPLTKYSDDGTLYSKFGYFPSAIALILGNLVHLPQHIIFQLGRWINVLLYAFVIFFAIRKLKSGKMIMSVIALLPTGIFLAANYNYDSWLIAFTLLGFAYLFSELQQPDKKITLCETIIMLGAFIIGLGPKAIYFPLLLSLFLLRPKKFKTTKQYKIFFSVVIILFLGIMAYFFSPYLIKGPGSGDRRGGGSVNAAQQVHFVLSDPIAYTKILLNFMKEYLNPLNFEPLATFWAYLGHISGFFLILGTLAVVVFTDKNEYDKYASTLKIKAWMIVIFVAIVSLIATALYTEFTPVRNEIINGVQSRYLIPLLFPLLFVIGSSRIKNPIDKNIYNLIIFTIMTAVLLYGIWALIISSYY
jgi:uncharacterized membrane protein